MITGDEYTAAYHAFDGELHDDVPEHRGEWALALTWSALPASCGRTCTVSQTPAVDPDRGWPFRAWCECGWTGPVRTLEAAAGVDLMNHAWPGWQDQPQEDDPRPHDPDRPRKGHWLERYTNRGSRVLRVDVCGAHTNWNLPALCRGVIPYQGAGAQLPGLIVACVCPAHWDRDEAKRRGDAERLYQAEWEQRTAERWRARREGRHVHHRPEPGDDGQMALF